MARTFVWLQDKDMFKLCTFVLDCLNTELDYLRMNYSIVKRKAIIRNYYNQIPHLTLKRKWERSTLTN